MGVRATPCRAWWRCCWATVLLLVAAAGSSRHAGAASDTQPRRPRIYLYPEDPEIIRHRQFEQIDTTFYGLDIVVYTMLKESPFVESDPEKADYFYLPLYNYWREPHPISDKAVARHLQSQGPWFDRKSGADHIFAWPGDFGRCEWGGWGPLAKSILLHHFGKVYSNGEPRASPCDPTRTWGDQCDFVIGSFRRILEEGPQGYQPCHFMGRDIVVPPTPWEHPQRSRYINPKLNLTRENLMFFAGPVNIHGPGSLDHNPDTPWTDAWYSFGARQSFAKMYNNTPGMHVHSKHVPNYFEELSKSKFCLAAAGWGWGGRMKFAVMHGCIPVIVQDGVLVEWEEQVPLHLYALRVPMWFLHRLKDTLEVLVRKGIADKMHRALDCTWRLHWWSRPHGRAFDLLMCELQARAAGRKLVLDVDACTMECGDGVAVRLRDPWAQLAMIYRVPFGRWV